MAYEKENGSGGIQEKITTWANMQKHIFIYWKIHADMFGNAGKTDTLVVFLKDAHHKWIEVKTEKGTLTPGQVIFMCDLWEAGVDVAVARSLTEYKNEIAYYLEHRQRRPEPPKELVVELTRRAGIRQLDPKRLRA